MTKDYMFQFLIGISNMELIYLGRHFQIGVSIPYRYF